MQLPVIGTLQEVFRNISSRRSRLIRNLVLPASVISFLSIYIWSIPQPSVSDASYYASYYKYLGIVYSLTLLSGVFWALFAVSCHRVYLDDPEEPMMIDGISFGPRQLRYIFKAAVVTLPFVVYGVLLGIFWLSWFRYSEGVAMPGLGRTAIQWATLIPIQYFASRISLTLPAAALNKKLSFSGAWKLSRGNGWRITAVILFGPAAAEVISFTILAGLPADSIVSRTLWIVVSLLAGVVAVGGLSFSYKWLSSDSDLNSAAQLNAVS